jgi:hypothetical protein
MNNIILIDLKEEQKLIKSTRPCGRHGEFSKLAMDLLLRQEIYFNKEYGHVHNRAVDKVGVGDVHDFGKHGEFSRPKRAITRQLGGASAER